VLPFLQVAVFHFAGAAQARLGIKKILDNPWPGDVAVACLCPLESPCFHRCRRGVVERFLKNSLKNLRREPIRGRWSQLNPVVKGFSAASETSALRCEGFFSMT
jgi:hypothetical protein